MYKHLFLLFLLFISACQDTKPRAQGGDNEIILVCSKQDKIELESILTTIFNDTLFTPQSEPHFKVIWVEPERFNEIKDYVNVIIGAIGEFSTNNGSKLIKNILTDEQYNSTISGDNHLIFSKDIYARDQSFLVINGPSFEKIHSLAQDQGPWIKKQVDDLFVKRQSMHLFNESTLQKELQNKLIDKYGWNIKIPWGYTVIRDSSDQQFFWIGRDMPFRWLAVQWKQGLLFSDSLSVANYAKIFPEKYFEHIQYSDYKFKVEPSIFSDFGSWKITGLWESIEDAQGGPFISHLFYDNSKDRTYFIHSMIFHPGKDKYLLLRQVDIIANTFQTEEMLFK